MERNEIWDGLKNQSPQVLVIGAGINGVGVFRDLAAQGVNVLLVDRGDFCSGASSASSHMAHGGIRYLENGEFRLVHEAVQERNRLIENAPHLVRPLPTAIPIFKVWSGLLNAPLKFLNLLDRPSERGALVIKLGLLFYDLFTRGQGTVPTHKFFDRDSALEKWPALNPEIHAVAMYYDGAILSPERLAVELVLDAEAEGPHARALNYVSFAGGRPGKILLKNELDGSEREIAPQIIVNAAGPWIDPVNQGLGLSRRYIGGTKGSHIILDNPSLRKAIDRQEFFFENKDGRIVLIFPYFDKVMVGTSDLPIENADDARCTDDEVYYFINLVERVFPNIPVTPGQIVFRFSGVRPLAYSQAKTAGQITRDHTLREDYFGDTPVFSLVGGKWTTYRAFAGQATDMVLRRLGLPRKTDTRSTPIGGGRDYPRVGYAVINYIKEVADATKLNNFLPRRLFERYGTRAMEIGLYLAAGPDAPLVSLPGYTRREIAFLATREKALHVSDILLRRSTIAWLGEASRAVVEEVAGVMAEALGWDKQRTKTEVAETLAVLAEHHGVRN